MTETTVRISALQSILALLGPRPAARSDRGGLPTVVARICPPGSAVGPDSPDSIRTRGDRHARTAATAHYKAG